MEIIGLAKRYVFLNTKHFTDISVQEGELLAKCLGQDLSVLPSKLFEESDNWASRRLLKRSAIYWASCRFLAYVGSISAVLW